MASFEAWLAASFLGEDRLIREVRAQIVSHARSDWPVLVTGETGTGKDEIVAPAVHRGSRRGARKAEVVAAPGLGETAWSVLFGHRKHSFTTALTDHEGVFGVARGSSVHIEDIPDLPFRVQPILLRAIEKKLFRPLGAKLEVHSDVRVIATANRPLDLEVKKGHFRADLYERLAVLKIVVPPLRAHLGDLRIYVPHFLRKAAESGEPLKRISDGGMNVLYEHPWPRNVREIENLIRRAVVEVPGEVVGADDLRRLLASESKAFAVGGLEPKRRIGRLLLARTLEETGGNKQETARRLGIARGTVYNLMRKFGIELEQVDLPSA